jgi:hypothetical protein
MPRKLVLAALCAVPTALVAQLRIDPTPTMVSAATTESGDLRFASAAWATRLASGEVAVADPGAASIRVLGANGALARTLGRPGAGPGEYRLPFWIGRCGANSVVVWDATARASTYSAAAAATETPVTRAIAEGASSLSASCASSGHLALLQGMQPRRDIPPVLGGDSPGGGQYQVVQMAAGLVVVDPQGVARTLRESVSQGQWAMGRISPQGGMGGVPRPLAPTTTFTFAGETLVIADGASGDVIGLAPDGREAFRFDAAGPARRPTAQDYARAAVAAVALVPPPMRADATKFVQAIPMPEQLPHFWRVMADPEGLIWLVTSAEAAPETSFRVYTREGRLVAEPRVPSALIPFEVGTSHLLGKRENADGEDEIVMLRVIR